MDALAHPYLDEGRLRFHSCMCRCCQTASPPGSVAVRRYAPDLEPSAIHPFEDHWERELTSTHQVRGNLNNKKKKIIIEIIEIVIENIKIIEIFIENIEIIEIFIENIKIIEIFIENIKIII